MKWQQRVSSLIISVDSQPYYVQCYITVNKNVLSVSSDGVRFPIKQELYYCLILSHPAESTNGEGRKEGNVLFNDALNTFYLRLYDVEHWLEREIAQWVPTNGD